MIWGVDPGLDGIGVAVFCPGVYRARMKVESVTAGVKAWQASVLVRTQSDEALPDRLGSIRTEFEALLELYPPSAVYVEIPAYDGQYARGGKQTRRGVNGLYLGTGAILATLSGRGVSVQVVRAGQAPKERRHEVLEAMAKAARIKLPAGPRGGKKADEYDAIWIGIWALAHHHGGKI